MLRSRATAPFPGPGGGSAEELEAGVVAALGGELDVDDLGDGPDGGGRVAVGVGDHDRPTRVGALTQGLHQRHLADQGHLEARGQLGTAAGAGRPSKRYTATAKGDQLDLPVRHDDVLVTLLGRALDMLPHDQAEAMAEEVGIEYGRLIAQSLGEAADHQRSFRSALHTVADALTAHGFAAHAEKKNDELRIVSEHCPFGEAVLTSPVICAVDRGMMKGMVAELYGADATLALESSLPMGDDVCVTALEA